LAVEVAAGFTWAEAAVLAAFTEAGRSAAATAVVAVLGVVVLRCGAVEAGASAVGEGVAGLSLRRAIEVVAGWLAAPAVAVGSAVVGESD